MSKPLAHFYRWDQLPKDSPMPLMERRRIIGEKMMISEVHLRRGFKIPTHRHDNEQFVVVLTGNIKFSIGADDSPERYEVGLKTGQVLHLPSNVPHSAEALSDTHILDIFSPISDKTGVDGKPGS